MTFPPLPKHLLAKQVHFSFEDRARIARCRRDYNRLGFAYQMTFLRLMGRFPRHQPIGILENLLAYVAQRLDLNPEDLQHYAQRPDRPSMHMRIRFVSISAIKPLERSSGSS